MPKIAMKTRTFSPPPEIEQRGFAVAPLLLAVALIGVVMAGFALSGRSISLTSANQEGSVYASTVLKIANDHKIALQRYEMNNAALPLDAAGVASLWSQGTGGLFEPGSGLATWAPPPTQAIELSERGNNRTWGVLPKVLIAGVGHNATQGNLTLFLPGVSGVVCRSINRTLYGDQFQGSTKADWSGYRISGIDLSNGDALQTMADSGGAPSLSGKAEGCFADVSASWNFTYFKVMSER